MTINNSQITNHSFLRYLVLVNSEDLILHLDYLV